MPARTGCGVWLRKRDCRSVLEGVPNAWGAAQLRVDRSCRCGQRARTPRSCQFHTAARLCSSLRTRTRLRIWLWHMSASSSVLPRSVPGAGFCEESASGSISSGGKALIRSVAVRMPSWRSWVRVRVPLRLAGPIELPATGRAWWDTGFGRVSPRLPGWVSLRRVGFPAGHVRPGQGARTETPGRPSRRGGRQAHGCAE